MVVGGLLILLLCVADAIRRPGSTWRGERERAAWLMAVFVTLPLLFLSVVGPFRVVAVGAMYVVRRTTALP